MRATFALVAAALIGSAQAHFRLNYPGGRGVFVADKEPEFCGGYPEATTNRTSFTLGDGLIAIRAGHSPWNIAVLLSTNPTASSFADFNSSADTQRFAVPASKQSGQGNYCIPINVSKLNLTDVKEGSNATLQVVFAGGDGNLFQCADVTFNSSAKVPTAQELDCITINLAGNSSAEAEHDHSHANASDSTSGSPAAPTGGVAAFKAPVVGGLMGLLGFAVLTL